MTTPTDIRPMREDDLAALARVQAACYTEIVPERPEVLAARRRASPSTCWVALAGGRVQAYVLVLPVALPALPALDDLGFTPPAQPDALYLHDLAVAAPLRGSGAGQRLVRHALDAGRALGLTRAVLIAIQGSAPFWARQGFAPAPADDALARKLESYGAGAALMARPL